MCGIAAVLQRDGSNCSQDVLHAMRDALWHRGPDDAGSHLDGPVGLAHRRLSILDLSPAGHQPMSNEDGTVWITFNGEIYNYVELAQELRARGHVFRSQSDTEVLVHLWEELGPQCLHRLNGMFAFVVWDSRTQTLFAARDRLGIKPLYFHDGRSVLALASEAKALLRHPAIPTALDREGLADTLFAGAPLEGRTMFAGIRQVPPAHMLIATRDGLRLERWWTLHYDYRHGISQHDRVEELNSLLLDAVHVHCRSDAPVGCHLSGGLDSSLVASLAARSRGTMDVFSVAFAEGAYYDESPHAILVAEAIGARRRIVTPTSADLGRLMGTLTWHQEQPLPDTAGFSYFAVSRLASEYVKVALTGHGGDEVFGGYPAQFRVAFGDANQFAVSPGVTPTRPSPGARLRALAQRAGIASLVRRVRGGPVLPPGVEGQWIREHCGSLPDRHPLLDAGLQRSLRGYDPVDAYLAPFRDAGTDQLFDRCLHHDLVQYLPILLMKEDRASMAVSIESRVPLLDHRVVEWMASVPPIDKVPRHQPKALLRAVAARHLPKQVVERKDKSPFPIPVREWIEGALRSFATDILSDRVSLDRGIFSPESLRDASRSTTDTLTMLGVEMWCRVFLDGEANGATEAEPSQRRQPMPLGSLSA